MKNISLDKSLSKPLYIQLYDAIVRDISDGFLPDKFKLPARRILAKQLSVSQNTVNEAYNMLADTGYIISIPKKGHFVSFNSGEFEDIPWDIDAGETYVFTPNAVDITYFKRSSYAKIVRNIVYNDGIDIFNHPEKNGEHSLRAAVAKYLYSFRDIKCSPRQIIIGAGSEYLLTQLADVLIDFGKIGMEVPGFSRSYCAFTDSGTDVINIPISMSGLNIDDLYKSNCSIFYCMPHCHYPTCYKMSEELKMDLLKWASESPGRYIIEDSYDSELTWGSSDTLYSMDKNGKVIFLNTFSRALCPGLKTAYMILPDELLSKWRKKHKFYSSFASKTDQYALAEFIEKGYYTKHYKTMRRVYRDKRELLKRELIESLGKKITISPNSDSTNVIVTFNLDMSSSEIKSKISAAGVKIMSIKEYSILPSPLIPKRTFLLGTGRLSTAQIKEACQRIAQALS